MHHIDHVMIHIETCFSELVCLLLHHDLLTLHLQTLALGRRNDDDRSTLCWRTCPHTGTHPHARTHPDTRLARVLALCLLIMTCITQGASTLASLVSGWVLA